MQGNLARVWYGDPFATKAIAGSTATGAIALATSGSRSSSAPRDSFATVALSARGRDDVADVARLAAERKQVYGRLLHWARCAASSGPPRIGAGAVGTRTILI